MIGKENKISNVIYSGKKNDSWGFFLEREDSITPCYEIDKEYHAQLFEGQSQGKLIAFREIDGYPYLTDYPEPTEAEKAKKHIERLKREIADRDYRALKALRLNTDIDVLYPGETDWYKSVVAEINELEKLLSCPDMTD